MPATAGSDTRLVYLWEDDASGNPNFAGTPNDSTYKTFGYSPTVTDYSFSNNPVNQFDPNSREAAERIAQAFSGTLGVEFTLSNPWFWRAVIADVSTSGSGPYTHTYDGGVPYPMQVTLPVEVAGNENLVKGFIPGSCTLDVADNGEVTVSLSGAFADAEETSPGVGSLTSQTDESYDPLMFADGALTFGGTTYDLVQSGTVTIENNIDMVPALGQRTPADYSPKVRSTTIDWDKIVENDDLLTEAYGGTAPQTRVDGDDEFAGNLVFDNGKSGADQNKQTINFAGTFPDSYSRTGHADPTADYLEQMSYYVRETDVVAENDTSTAL